MTEKVLSIKAIDRVEDKDWVASKEWTKEANAGKAPAIDTSVTDKVVMDAEDPDLKKTVFPINK